MAPGVNSAQRALPVEQRQILTASVDTPDEVVARDRNTEHGSAGRGRDGYGSWSGPDGYGLGQGGHELTGLGWMLPVAGEHPGFTLARVAGLAAVAVGAGAVAHLGPDVRWALLAVVTAWASGWARTGTALAGAAAAWALQTGFAPGRYGDLSFAPADRIHLVLLLATGLIVTGLVRTVTTRRGRRTSG